MTFGSSGTRTGMDNSNPEVQEGKGKRKNPFPKFGNGKGMKEKHSKSKGTGKGRKNPFPYFGNRNQRLSFPGMDGNGNSCSPLYIVMFESPQAAH